jgi:hypothetical protein
MKSAERKIARNLRIKGWSLRAISSEIKCAKSSVSKWIQDIPLTYQQVRRLKSNQDIGRAKAANHPNSPKKKWEKIRFETIQSAAKEIPSSCSNNELKYLGAALYWAEGYKASRSAFVFSNSDPGMIKIMRAFLNKVCRVPHSKFRGKVQIHPHLDSENAMKYWSKISGIPISQFHKTLFSLSRAGMGKRDTLPLGTFNIIISDVILCSKIKGWVEGIKKWGS